MNNFNFFWHKYIDNILNVKYDMQNIYIAYQYYACHIFYAIVVCAFNSLKKVYGQYKTCFIHLTQRNMSIQLVFYSLNALKKRNTHFFQTNSKKVIL